MSERVVADLEKRGRPDSKVSLDMEGRWPHIPAGYIKAYMITDFEKLVTYLSNLEVLSDDMLSLLLDDDYGLEARYELLDSWVTELESSLKTLLTLVATRVMGRLQIATATEDLNQAAGTYDLFTGNAQAVVLERLTIKMPTGDAGGSVTSIAIATDDVAAGTIISAVDGAVANLTSETDIGWVGILFINVGTKIRLTIAGGAHGSKYLTTITAQYRALVDGGYLEGGS